MLAIIVIENEVKKHGQYFCLPCLLLLALAHAQDLIFDLRSLTRTLRLCRLAGAVFVALPLPSQSSCLSRVEWSSLTTRRAAKPIGLVLSLSAKRRGERERAVRRQGRQGLAALLLGAAAAPVPGRATFSLAVKSSSDSPRSLKPLSLAVVSVSSSSSSSGSLSFVHYHHHHPPSIP